jgi:hypothetical protein
VGKWGKNKQGGKSGGEPGNETGMVHEVLLRRCLPGRFETTNDAAPVFDETGAASFWYANEQRRTI